jgi:hypothetical protein
LFSAIGRADPAPFPRLDEPDDSGSFGLERAGEEGWVLIGGEDACLPAEADKVDSLLRAARRDPSKKIGKGSARAKTGRKKSARPTAGKKSASRPQAISDRGTTSDSDLRHLAIAAATRRLQR